jgi:hypothetical protein
MNHYGVAREASALYDLPLRPIEPKLPAAQGKSEVTIEIQEPDLCPRFTGREIRKATTSSRRLRKHCIAPGADRSATHQQRSRRHELRSVGERQADARLRSRSARRPAPGHPQSAGWRNTEDAGRRRAQTHYRGSCCSRCGEAGRACRSDGRLGHDDHRENEEYADRIRVVRSGRRCAGCRSGMGCTPTRRIALSAVRISNRPCLQPTASPNLFSIPAAARSSAT